MASTLTSMSSQIGLALIVLNVLVDQAGLPVPAGPTLIVAGAVVVEHPLWGVELLVGAAAVSVIADLGWFLAGRWYGNAVMKFLCRISLTPDSCVSETQERFERWGPNAVILAKFVPGLGIIAPPLAGALRMTAARFAALAAIGSVLWVAVFLSIGAALHREIDRLLPVVERYAAVAFGVLGALLAAYVLFKWWERRRFYASLRMARITIDELYQLMEAGAAPVIIDVRTVSAEALDPQRIPGALHVPRDAVDTRLKAVERDREVVVYCTCPSEASAARVAKLLMANGFTRVRPLQGGLDAWIAAGYPVERVPHSHAADGEARQERNPIFK